LAGRNVTTQAPFGNNNISNNLLPLVAATPTATTPTVATLATTTLVVTT